MNRFSGLSTRERYLREYRENRMFNSYLHTDYDFGGDTARKNGYRSWVMRHSRMVGWKNQLRFEVFDLKRGVLLPEYWLPF